MILQFLQFLMVLLVGSNNEPTYDLRKRTDLADKIKGINWTFIILTLAMVLFFVVIFVFQIGNEYPNELMSNL